MNIKDNIIGKIDGLGIELVSYKFLWRTFCSRHKLRVRPGYFIDKNGDKIVLENEIVKSIYKPKVDTWYYVYLYYHRKVADIIFHDKIDNYANYHRIASILINKKRRIEPFKQCTERFEFIRPPVQTLKNLTAPDDIEIIKRMLKKPLDSQYKDIKNLSETEDKYVLKIDNKFVTVDSTGWPVLDKELCGRTTLFSKASGEDYKNNLIGNKLRGEYVLALISKI